MRKWLFLAVLFLFCTTLMHAQATKNKNFIYLSNDFKNQQIKVYIKWFSEELKTPEGYNIYRKANAETGWTKINPMPVIIAPTFPSTLDADEDLKGYYEAVKGGSEAEVNGSGIIKALAKLKCIENTDFALVMGLGYIDNTVMKNQTYIYEIRMLKKGVEKVVITSNPFNAKEWKQEESPKNIKIEKKKGIAQMSWLPEPERYFSINVFRKKRGEPDFKKLNDATILINKNKEGKYPKAMFTDPKVHPDSVYIYKICAIDYFGQASAFSEEIIIARKDFEPPLPPDSITYDQDILNVKLTWKANTDKDLLGYNVFRGLKYAGEYQKVNTALIQNPTPKFTDKVDNPNEYFYKIAAVDSSGNETESSPMMADIRDVVPPEIPKNFKVVAEAGKIIFTWDMNTEKDVKGYNLYKSPQGGTDFIIINGPVIKTNSYQEKMPKQIKTKWVYKINVIDSSYNVSEFSPSIMVQMPDVVPPAQPLIKNISVNNEKPTVTWIPNVDNDLKNYALFRTKFSKDTTRVPLNVAISKTDTLFEDASAESNETYKYALYASDSTGNISPSSTPYLFKYINTNTKLKVKKFDAKFNKKDKTVTINWVLEKDKDYYGCVLFRAFDNEDMSQYTPKIVEPTEFIDKLVKKSGKYQYQLRIYDKVGNIVKSELVDVKVVQ